MLVLRFRKLRPGQQACAVLVVLQISFLPTLAVLGDSIIYDAERQFLFILPGIAILSATALAWIVQRLGSNLMRLAVFTLFFIGISPVASDMIALHPYEYVYFNRVFGGLNQAHNRFDTDYYGLSMREGMEWINANAEPGTVVVSSNPFYSSETFAAPDIQVVHISEFDQQRASPPYFYIASPRYDFQERFPDCPVVYEVARQSVPLTIVKKCGHQ
jgi:hypothetical protein